MLKYSTSLSLMYMIIWCSKEYPVEMSRLFSMVEYSKSGMNQIFDKEQMFHVFTSVKSESIAWILREILLFKKLNTGWFTFIDIYSMWDLLRTQNQRVDRIVLWCPPSLDNLCPGVYHLLPQPYCPDSFYVEHRKRSGVINWRIS